MPDVRSGLFIKPSQQLRPRLFDRCVGMPDDVHSKGFIMRRKLRLASNPVPSAQSSQHVHERRGAAGQHVDRAARDEGAGIGGAARNAAGRDGLDAVTLLVVMPAASSTPSLETAMSWPVFRAPPENTVA
jgi:hypothetical protein